MSLLLRRNSSQLRLLQRLGATATEITRLLSSDNSENRNNNNNNNDTDNNNVAVGNQLQSKRKVLPPVADADIKKSVFISQSHDIFTNLALEDWLYKNFDFVNHHVLLLWANDPCVVIGRHQNPFTEANVSNLIDRGITLARRNSGGGAVYHDRGNLNCTFFTPRERYDRKYNLNIVTRALFREWAIKTEINNRDDIVIGNKKVRHACFLSMRVVHLLLNDL